MKNRIATIGIIIATLILAGVAVFTAIRLYQLRQEAVAPTAPTSKPKAQEVPIACQSLAFTLSTGTPTPTPAACNESCNVTIHPPINCQTGLICYQTSSLVGAPGVCRNPSCAAETDCLCGTSTPIPTPTPTPTSTPTPVSTATPGPTSTPIAGATPTGEAALPEAGISFPTIFGIGLGTILLIGAILLAL